jgi:hypothetical protein
LGLVAAAIFHSSKKIPVNKIFSKCRRDNRIKKRLGAIKKTIKKQIIISQPF